MSRSEFSHELLPLGIFGAHPLDDLTEDELLPLVDQIDLETRKLVAAYLRAGQSVLAFMAYSRDVIADKFGVSGGPAIWTDGVYFYRHEAAEYIETYGIGIPADAITLMSLSDWKPPKFQQADVVEYSEWLRANAKHF